MKKGAYTKQLVRRSKLQISEELLYRFIIYPSESFVKRVFRNFAAGLRFLGVLSYALEQHDFHNEFSKIAPQACAPTCFSIC
jgi:hypothetical protein